MLRVHQLLSDLCEDLEKQVKPNLMGAMGNLVNGYLPQVWVFESEYGSCTLFLDIEGYARVFPGADKDRDVTLRWRNDAFETVLESRSRDSLAAGDYPDVIVHTDKGRAAFNYLRKEIGL
jgi:hypothetical protein